MCGAGSCGGGQCGGTGERNRGRRQLLATVAKLLGLKAHLLAYVVVVLSALVVVVVVVVVVVLWLLTVLRFQRIAQRRGESYGRGVAPCHRRRRGLNWRMHPSSLSVVARVTTFFAVWRQQRVRRREGGSIARRSGEARFGGSAERAIVERAAHAKSGAAGHVHFAVGRVVAHGKESWRDACGCVSWTQAPMGRRRPMDDALSRRYISTMQRGCTSLSGEGWHGS